VIVIMSIHEDIKAEIERLGRNPTEFNRGLIEGYKQLLVNNTPSTEGYDVASSVKPNPELRLKSTKQVRSKHD